MHNAVDGAAAPENNADDYGVTLRLGNKFSIVYAEHSDFGFYNSEVWAAQVGSLKPKIGNGCRFLKLNQFQNRKSARIQVLTENTKKIKKLWIIL